MAWSRITYDQEHKKIVSGGLFDFQTLPIDTYTTAEL